MLLCEQMFLALFNGATLVVLDETTRLDPSALEHLLLKEQITHLHATPVSLKPLMQAVRRFKTCDLWW